MMTSPGGLVTTVMARLVLAMLMLPATGAVFLILVFAITRRAGPPQVLHLVGIWIVIDAFVASYWLLRCRAVVRWPRRRVAWTLAASIIALLAGCAFGLFCMSLNRLLPLQVIVL